MKRILCIVLIITMCSLCGCGSKEENQLDKQVVKVTTSKADKEVSRDETTTNEESAEENQTTVDIETTIEEKNTITSETTTTEVVTTQAPTTTPAPTTTEPPATTQAATTEPITTTQATTTSSNVNVNVNGAFKSFSVATLDGQTVTQEAFSKADVNVVIIWTTWCGYCKLEMPALQKVMEKYNGQSVQFFSIAADYGLGADEESVKYWIDQMQVTYPCMLYNDSLSDGYMENIEGYPTTLYLNKNGEIMMEFPGAYAAYGEDYAIDAHSYYLDFCLANPNYLPEE